MPIDIPLTSSIPDQAIELFDGDDGSGNRLFRYELDGEIVGYRVRDGEGLLIRESGYRGSVRHGCERHWDEQGRLEFETCYVDGLEHGVAKQFFGGELVGTYRLEMGTGVDLWRQAKGILSEERHLKDGDRHGFERWWHEDNRTVWQESHFKRGKEHGIFRIWRARKLGDGYRRYFVDGERVTKRQYLRACVTDPTLPPYRDEDNQPFRELPVEFVDSIAE